MKNLQFEQLKLSVKNAYQVQDMSKIYPSLKGILKETCELFEDIEKEVVMISGLTLFSGLINNVQGFYFDRHYSANLFLYILAPYGAGKGSINIAKKLCFYIDKALKDETQKEFDEWKNGNPKKGEKFKGKRKMLIIPVDNSRTGVIQNIDDNEGTAIFFETESDRLSNALNTEYGNFKDVLRQVYHHEELNFNRRTDDEIVFRKDPKITVLLAGTADQFIKLIPSVENGLFSRFCFYLFESNDEFRNPFEIKRKKAQKALDKLAKRTQEMYNVLKKREKPIIVELSPEQIKIFVEMFSKEKKNIIEHLSSNIQGSIHRLALQVFRVCLILTALRLEDKNELKTTKKVIVNDEDFITAFRFGGIFKQNFLKVMEMLPLKAQKKIPNKEEKKQEARKRFAEGESRDKIMKDLKISRTTLYRYLN